MSKKNCSEIGESLKRLLLLLQYLSGCIHTNLIYEKNKSLFFKATCVFFSLSDPKSQYIGLILKIKDGLVCRFIGLVIAFL